MINKVNRPSHLSLVKGAKASENDPGASSGSGVAYEALRDERNSKQNQKSSREENEDESTDHSDAPHFVEQIGMTEVVKDLMESAQARAEQGAGNRPGLSVKYQNDNGSAKGLLLNKKAE